MGPTTSTLEKDLLWTLTEGITIDLETGTDRYFVSPLKHQDNSDLSLETLDLSPEGVHAQS